MNKTTDSVRKLYHVTLKKNVPTIMRVGLQPLLGATSKVCETIPRVYLFTNLLDVEDALANWFGGELSEKFPNDETTVLEINATVEQIDGEYEAFEVYTEKAIPPSLIREMSIAELGFDPS